MEQVFLEYKKRFLDNVFQLVLFDENGVILASDHTFEDLRPLIGTSVYDHNTFLFSIKEVVETLSHENDTIDFPRMEIPMGDKQGVFDYEVKRTELDGKVLYFWSILDNTKHNQYLSAVQQERNEVAIQLELEKLKEENVKLNERVEARTAEIIKQHELIQKQSSKILKSIQYAKRIQEALLPEKGEIPHFPYPHFVYYQARDIVCGDFYWYKDLGFGKYLIAVADCTGHGVPGAFMTVLGISILNQIIEESFRLPKVKDILASLDERVLRNLQSKSVSNEVVNDGMDIALCMFDTVLGKVTFSGAKRPLYRMSGSEFYEYKGSPFPIGSNQFKTDKVFDEQEITYKNGDVLYLITDGYQDQFGGPDNRKFMIGNLKKIMKNIHHMPLEDQSDIFQTIMSDWKGDYKQTDDILVMGIKL